MMPSPSHTASSMMHSHQQHHHHQQQQQHQFQFQQHQADEQQQQQYLQHQQRLQHEQQQQQQEQQQQQQQQQQQPSQEEQYLYHANPQYRYLSPSTTAGGVPVRKVPCKARNMPPDHDEETAYFLIPVDAPHGLLLGCSHLACGGRSKRFRYCAICRVPVSKRNFSSRHKHDVVMGTVLTEEDRQAVVAGNNPSITSPTAVESNPDVVGSSVPSPSSSTPSDRAGAAANNNKNSSSSDVMMRQLRLSDDGPLNGNGAGEKVTRVLNRQELQWLDLLHHRPTDLDSNGTEFKKWMAALVSAARDTPVATSSARAHHQGHSSRGTNAGYADYEDGDDGEDDDDDDDDYGDSDDSGNSKERAGSRRSARMTDRMQQMRDTEDRRSGTNGPPRERSDRVANQHIINGNKSDLSMKFDEDDDDDDDVHVHVHGREEEKTERRTDDRNDRNNNSQIHDYDEVAQLAPPRENRRSFLQRHESSQLEEDPLPKRAVRRGKGPDGDESGASCKSQETASRKVRPNQGHESMRSDAMSSIAMSSGRDISVTMEEIYGFDVEEVFD